MAKGLRSSTKKANKSNLRNKIFGPVEDARKQRLSAKLLDLASQSHFTADKDILMGEAQQDVLKKHASDPAPALDATKEEMEIDVESKATAVKSSKSAGSSRIQKKGRAKARASMIFPVYKNGKKIGSGRKKRN